MKLLKLPPYNSIEQVSSSHLGKNLTEAFVNANFEIEIYCPTPSRGIDQETRKKYSKILYEEKYGGLLKIHRFKMFAEGHNSIQRAIRYILCNIIQYLKGCNAKNVDVIFGQSTPPTQGLLCALVGRHLHVPFVYNLQDIFPDSLVNTGLTHKGSILWKIGRVIENFTYKNADKIIVISDDFKRNIMAKGVPEDKIVVVPNWIDTNAVKPIPKEENYLFQKYSIDKDKFIIVYAGNLGLAQNINVIIEAAKKLINQKKIQFVIFGKGAQENEYKMKANGLTNMLFFPIQPYSEVSYVYSLGDLSIVSCKEGCGTGAMPSKTWSIMATGTPVLACFDKNTELEKMIVKEKVGLFSEANDVDMLVSNILYLFYQNDLRRKYGENAREFVVNNLSCKNCTQKYVNTIQEIIKN